MGYEFDGRFIGKRRRAKGFSLERLAERTGISAAHIGRLEKSVFVPSAVTLANLAEALECTPEALFRECVRAKI